MTARQFSNRFGWLMFAGGILSLIPGFEGPSHDLSPLRLNVSYGKFFGYLPLNIMSKILLISLGLSGILVAKKRESSEDASIDYSRVLFYITGMIASFSFASDTNTLFGYMPVNHGAGIFFAFLALLAFHYGYGTRRARLHDSEPEKYAV